jgi:antitoxin CptB
MNAADDVELGRMRWRCRRGMRELDQLLTRWIDREWTTSSESERGVFLRLLDCEDDKLWRWFLGRETAPDVALDSLVQRIRSLPA